MMTVAWFKCGTWTRVNVLKHFRRHGEQSTALSTSIRADIFCIFVIANCFFGHPYCDMLHQNKLFIDAIGAPDRQFYLNYVQSQQTPSANRIYLNNGLYGCWMSWIMCMSGPISSNHLTINIDAGGSSNSSSPGIAE